MATFDIMNRIRVGTQCANVDDLYGPYTSIEEALLAVTPRRRVKGRTLGIIENDSIIEYWWENGTEDADLVPKTNTILNQILGDFYPE